MRYPPRRKPLQALIHPSDPGRMKRTPRGQVAHGAVATLHARFDARPITISFVPESFVGGAYPVAAGVGEVPTNSAVPGPPATALLALVGNGIVLMPSAWGHFSRE